MEMPCDPKVTRAAAPAEAAAGALMKTDKK
jgi:hypothetical protein